VSTVVTAMMVSMRTMAKTRQSTMRFHGWIVPSQSALQPMPDHSEVPYPSEPREETSHGVVGGAGPLGQVAGVAGRLLVVDAKACAAERVWRMRRRRRWLLG
jgi:hypothetical protein